MNSGAGIDTTMSTLRIKVEQRFGVEAIIFVLDAETLLLLIKQIYRSQHATATLRSMDVSLMEKAMQELGESSELGLI